MNAMGSRLRAAFLSLGVSLLLLVAGPMQAQTSPESTQTLSVPQARVLARQAFQSGNLALADQLATVLLQRDSKDAEALILRALVARRAGALDIAEKAATDAYRFSDNPALQFDAAFLVADIKTLNEQFTRAEFWLRRADNVATDDARREAARRAFQNVSRLNPLSVQLRFTARPSNNVNNGAETLVIDLGGLPFFLDPSGQQLGGYEASTGISLAYRLFENETQKTEALAELFYRKIWLDSDAKELVPTAQGSDFDYGVVIVGIRDQRLIWPDLGITEITTLVGQSAYGHADLARWGEVKIGQTVRQSDTQQLRFATTLRTEKRLDSDVNSSDSLAFSVDMTRAAESGGTFGVGATFKNVWSDSGTVDLASVALRANRALDRIGAIQPRFNTSVEQRNYHKFSAIAGGRDDTTLSLGIDVTFPDVSYFGFVPQASLQARRTWSTVDIYDRNEYSFGITAVSRF
ncbi:surface lipoprotein assembly modifier [Boseongicola aestuarii]|nr:surface lipoprotein assembly modifier [Boseongicola aestuarii]